MQIELRRSPSVLRATDVLIHMGSGETRFPIASAIRNYEAYRGLVPGRPTRGAFMISTYAVIDGVSELDILSTMPQQRFARATRAELSDVAIYPTWIAGSTIADRIMAVHFDILIPDDGWEPPAGGADHLSESDERDLELLLTPPTAKIMRAFRPAPPRLGADKRQLYPDAFGRERD